MEFKGELGRAQILRMWSVRGRRGMIDVGYMLSMSCDLFECGNVLVECEGLLGSGRYMEGGPVGQGQ